MAASFEDFMKSVPEEHKEYVSKLHQRLIEQGCAFVLKEARSGYTVSYQWNKKTVMNWVFRKAGMLARIKLILSTGIDKITAISRSASSIGIPRVFTR